MNKDMFLGMCKRILSEYGFEKRKSSYYRDCGRIMILIDIVRSNYSDSYYFDYGYCIKEINRGLPYPKIWEMDLRGRLALCLEKSKTQVYEASLDAISGDDFEETLRNAIEAVMIPSENQGDSYLRDIVNKKVCNATGWAMEYLGIEDDFDLNDG